MDTEQRVYAKASGRVQGVGFRYFCRATARRLEVTGWVRNLPRGDVEMEAQAAPDVLEEFLGDIRTGCGGAFVKELKVTDVPVEKGEEGFEIKF